MTPQIQYLLMMAQRFGNTPVGQMFQQRAAQALERFTLFERNRPPQMRDPVTKYFMTMTPADKAMYMPFSRGAAGLAGAAAVGAGSGQFEGVRDRLMASPEAAPSTIPPSVFGELDAIGGGREPRPLTIPASRPSFQSSDMSARFLDGPSTYQPDYSGYGGGDSPREIMMQRALAATAAPAREAASRAVMPSSPPLPPRRPAEASPAASGPSARDLWERYNETGSAADFVRADMATPRLPREGRADGGGIPEGMMGMRGMQPMDLPPMDLPPMPDVPMPSGPDMGSAPDLGPSPTPKPAGAGAGGRDAAINKALEIIHHLVIRRP